MNALLIIDIQNDFLPGGNLPVAEGDEIIPTVNALMPHYDLVVATQDFHPQNHGSFASNHIGKKSGEVIQFNGLSQMLWPDHCVQGTRGATFASALHLDGIDQIFQKGTDPEIDSYSGFFDNGHLKSTGLAEFLKANGVTEVHLVGLATDYCVKFSALDSLEEGFRTKLIKDACRGVNAQDGDVDEAVSFMKKKGVQVIASSEILGETVTLFRPVGPEELVKLEENQFSAWPPRLPEQPIFYPVLNQVYAEQIAEEWNIQASGSGYVTRFRVKRSFLKSYPRQVVGGRQHEELWIPAEDLDELNKNIIGKIEVIKRFEPIPEET